MAIICKFNEKWAQSVKVKVKPPRPRGGQRYSSTLSLTSTLDGVGGQCHAPATLPLGETRYPLHTRLGGPQGQCGQARKISPPPGFDPWTIQPIASHYTNWAIVAHKAQSVLVLNWALWYEDVWWRIIMAPRFPNLCEGHSASVSFELKHYNSRHPKDRMLDPQNSKFWCFV